MYTWLCFILLGLIHAATAAEVRVNQLVHQLNRDQYAQGRDLYRLDPTCLTSANPFYVFQDGVSTIQNAKDDLIANMFMPLPMVEQALSAQNLTLYKAPDQLKDAPAILGLLEGLLSNRGLTQAVLAFNIIFGLPATYNEVLLPWLEGRIHTLPPLFTQLLAYRLSMVDQTRARFMLALGYVRCVLDIAKHTPPEGNSGADYDTTIAQARAHLISPFLLEMIRTLFKVSPITDFTLDVPAINAFIQRMGVMDRTLLDAVIAYHQAHAPRWDPTWVRSHGLRHVNVLVGTVKGEATCASLFTWPNVEKEALALLRARTPS